MPFSPLDLFLGFVLGVVATAIAWNLNTRSVRNPETAKLTGVWSFQDIAAPGTRPAVVATRIEGIQLPEGAKVIVPPSALAAVPDDVLRRCEVRTHAEARLNAAIGRDRALVFSGPLHPKAVVTVTMDANTVRRLQLDFQRMWSESQPYVEQVPLSALGGKDGRVVETTGRVGEVLEYRGRKMLRVTDGKVSVGVVARNADVGAYQGGQVRVVGRMHKESVPYIEADRVEMLAEAA